MKTSSKLVVLSSCLLSALVLTLSSNAWAHGNVTPQAVDTAALPVLGAGWKTENPFRGNAEAIKIGTSAFTQNCARCHGLDAISGGIAPDLRKLDNECVTLKVAKKQAQCLRDVDEYFVGRVRHGVSRNGAVYMPPFEGILNQEAAWSSRVILRHVGRNPWCSPSKMCF